MKTTTANYDTENAKDNVSPVIIVEFDGITRKYSSGTFGDITADYKKYIKTMESSFLNIDLLKAPLALIGRSSFEIIEDENLDVTDKLKDYDMEGRDVTIKMGFQALNDADFVIMPTVTPEKIELVGNGGAYRFITKDARKLLKKRLFRAPATNNLDGAINNAIGTVTLDSTSGFIDPTNNPDYLLRGGASQKAYIITSDREIIGYTGITGTGHGGGAEELTGAVRGLFGTGAIAHEDNAEVVQFYGWNELGLQPHETLLNLLMTTDDGSGHAYYDLASFDSGFNRMGLGLTASEVNILDIERMGLWFSGGVSFLHGVWEFAPAEPVKFIENKLLKPLGWYLYLDKDGKLTVGCFDRVWIDLMFDIGNLWDSNGQDVPVATIATADIVDGSLTIASDQLINQLEMSTTNRPTGFESDTVITYKLDESVTDYGAIQTPFALKTTAWLLTSTPQEDDVTYGYLAKWLYFWGNTPGFIKLRTHFDQWLLDPGDFVQITYDKFPELKDGTRGWTTKKALITGQPSINWLSEPSAFEFDLITWELFNRVDLETSFTTVTETMIDAGTGRSALTFSATNDETVEAADAYVDLDGTDSKPNSPTTQVCLAIIEVTPNGGGTGDQWIELALHAQNPSGTDIVAARVTGSEGAGKGKSFNFIHFDSSDSTVFDVILPFIARTTFTLDTFKVDWFDASAGAGVDRPTLKFKELRYFTFAKAMSEVT